MEQWRVSYQWHKETVRQMILEENGKHEEKITSEIKQAKDSGKKMWMMINKLKGNEEIENSESEVYNSYCYCLLCPVLPLLRQ